MLEIISTGVYSSASPSVRCSKRGGNAQNNDQRLRHEVSCGDSILKIRDDTYHHDGDRNRPDIRLRKDLIPVFNLKDSFKISKLGDKSKDGGKQHATKHGQPTSSYIDNDLLEKNSHIQKFYSLRRSQRKLKFDHCSTNLVLNLDENDPGSQDLCQQKNLITFLRPRYKRSKQSNQKHSGITIKENFHFIDAHCNPSSLRYVNETDERFSSAFQDLDKLRNVKLSKKSEMDKNSNNPNNYSNNTGRGKAC